MILYKVDKNGLLEYKEHRLAVKPQIETTDGDGIVTFEDDPTYIDVEPPTNLLHPKWQETEWVEGGTAPESTPQPPAVEERLETAENTILSLLFMA